MSLCCSQHNPAHKSAFVKSPYLRWIVGDVRFKGSLPHPDYIHRLTQHFRESPTPEYMRRVVFSPDKILCEYVSASCHLPGAYVQFLPCPRCTYEGEEERASFVEVFHVANAHNPNVCATVTFTMPAFSSLAKAKEPTGCIVEVEFTKGCPNAPLAVDHSPRVAPHIHTDVLIDGLRFLPRSELEKAMMVSRRWSNITEWAEGSLQQRRSFFVFLKFYGDSPGMLTVHFVRRESRGWRILRILTTHGLSQALYSVRAHLQNAFVEAVFPSFVGSVPLPGPPRDVLVDIPLPRRLNWIMSLMHSMPHNSEINGWSVHVVHVGFDNLLPLVRCALKPHTKLSFVRELELGLTGPNATWTQLVTLLNQPSIRRFSEIICSTRASVDTSELRTILSTRHSAKLRLVAFGGIEQLGPLLTLPAQLIRDFLALRDVSSFVAEFSLKFARRDSVEIAEMPDVDDATDRRKRFRYHLQGKNTVVRVNVYANRAAREWLTVVTFDDFRRTVRFFNGNVSLADLKLTFRRAFTYC